MSNELVPIKDSNIEAIKDRILEIRGQRVMLDRDLAELYGVETKVLNQAVKRNISRFPEDFMFVLSDEEWMRLRSQIATSNTKKALRNVISFEPHSIKAENLLLGTREFMITLLKKTFCRKDFIKIGFCYTSKYFLLNSTSGKFQPQHPIAFFS